ncbi:MAG: hypothetical protein LBM96_10375 [Methanobrevibacter sp.]|jgi:hypothetical protein|nr:hypothetical protein [Candidatus Methanoflexus mossambicus]
MIKNLKEWRKYATKLSDKNITVKESTEIKKQLNEYEKKHPQKFREMAEAKWSGKGLKVIHADGTVTIL